MSSAPHNPQPAALKALIAAAKSHGTGINEQDVDGCTPLIWAVHNNHYVNAKILIDAGADVTLKVSLLLLRVLFLLITITSNEPHPNQPPHVTLIRHLG